MATTEKTLSRVLVAFYNVPGVGPDSVETKVIGHPATEYAALENLILKKYPQFKPGQLRRVGSVVELRDSVNSGFINVSKGMTVRQIFEGLTDGQEPVKTVGKVFFEGSPFLIILTYVAGGQIKIVLHPRLGSDSAIRFPDVISGQRLAAELPEILKGILGANVRDLTFNFRNV